jgi:hypothetical protein
MKVSDLIRNKKLSTKSSPELEGFTCEFYHLFEEGLMPTFINSSKNRRRRNIPY